MPWLTRFAHLIDIILRFSKLPFKLNQPSTTRERPTEHGASMLAIAQPIKVIGYDEQVSQAAIKQSAASITLTTLPQELRDMIYNYINMDQLIVWVVPDNATSHRPPYRMLLAILKNPFKREGSLLHVNRQLRYELLERLFTKVTLTKCAALGELRELAAKAMPSPNSIRMMLAHQESLCRCQVAERYTHEKLFSSIGVAEFVKITPRLESLQIDIDSSENGMPCDVLECHLRDLIAAHGNLNVLSRSRKGSVFSYHLKKA